jgi:hypothetical protein
MQWFIFPRAVTWSYIFSEIYKQYLFGDNWPHFVLLPGLKTNFLILRPKQQVRMKTESLYSIMYHRYRILSNGESSWDSMRLELTIHLLTAYGTTAFVSTSTG